MTFLEFIDLVGAVAGSAIVVSGFAWAVKP